MGKKKSSAEEEDSGRRYWLLKTEPSEWSWTDQAAAADNGTALWDGVRNKQAQKNMKSMSPGDLCFFYHSGSGAGSRRVVGVVEVVRGWSEGDEAVEVRAVGEMRREVGLGEMKERLADRKAEFGLLRQPRLSVVPVHGDIWVRVCEMGGGYAGDGGDDVA
ncbi:hypothetical protein MLD38_013746 [Melastoma candidum]|uniref:Uncharacterized protein n=1 Tax=Melastoma candidum TaxID=119954 RepID=A0ACB9RE92_9MYRT|nr:hypothetical protein MLD38_013746 [Melastoma candidum]